LQTSPIGDDSFEGKFTIQAQFGIQDAQNRCIHALREGRVLLIFAGKVVQGLKDGIVWLNFTRAGKIFQIEHIVASQKSRPRDGVGVEAVPGRIKERAHGFAAEALTDRQTACLAPARQRFNRQELRQRRRVKADRAGGGADIPLKPLKTNVGDHQTVCPHAGVFRGSHRKKRGKFNLFQLFKGFTNGGNFFIRRPVRAAQTREVLGDHAHAVPAADVQTCDERLTNFPDPIGVSPIDIRARICRGFEVGRFGNVQRWTQK